MSCPYKSLVFLDLEATGLPNDRPRITEITLVACSAKHFQYVSGTGTDRFFPRVQHKLSLCVNPEKKIHPEAVLITGLDNFLLADENAFDRRTICLLQCFLGQLQQPICLIAHNGSRFDFPLLAKYCQETGMPLDVKCVDSLPIFRNIDKEEEQLKAFLNSELDELSEANADSQELFEDAVEFLPESNSTDRPASPDIFSGLFEDNDMDETLTQLTEKAELLYANEYTTPENKRIKLETPPKVLRKPMPPPISRTLLRPRQLFTTRSYKLVKIHERLFGTLPPIAHRAEEDTLILLKCARFKAQEFLNHIPTFHKDLQSFQK